MKRLMAMFAIAALAVVGLAPASQAHGSKAKYEVELSGDNEVPPVATDGEGEARFRVRSDGTVRFRVVVEDLRAPVAAAHIHMAPAGVNGPVIVDLLANADRVRTNGDKTKFRGSFVMPDGFIANANAGLLYVNVHTSAVPSGEVRGQLELD